MDSEDKTIDLPAAPTIIIVEDDALIAVDLKQHLEELGYVVMDSFTAAEAAINYLEQRQPGMALPDLVMMDIVLQGKMDGIQAAEIIRDQWAIPLIFTTAYAEMDRVNRAKLTYPFGYLLKPYHERDLTITVAMALFAGESDRKRRAAEQALRRNKLLLDATEQLSHVGGWEWDVINETMFWTKETYRIHEFDLDEVLPGSPEHIERSLTCYDPADRGKILSAFRNCASSGQPYDLELPFTTVKGRRIWIRTMGHPVYEGDRIIKIIGNIMDITERKLAEKELLEKTSIAQTFMDALPCVALLLRPKTREIVALNKAAREAGARLGSTCFQSWPKTDKPCFFCQAPAAWETGRPRTLEVENLGIFWEAHWVPVTDDLYLHYAFDITKRKLAEKDREKIQAQLFHAQKMETVGVLSGGIAHDFNNLLQAINGYTQLLLMDKNKYDPEYASLQAILKAGNKAADLIRQLLLFSRRQVSQVASIRLNQEVEYARRIIEHILPKTINIEIHAGRQLWDIQADPAQIEMILLNLSKNAAEAMPDGGKLVIKTQNVTLDEDYAKTHSGAKPGRYVLLTVSDTGHGMDNNIVEHIFEPFYTTKEVGKGTGLGLASVYGIVKSHGGYITCESRIGHGTSFGIYLPATEARDSRQAGDQLSPGPV